MASEETGDGDASLPCDDLGPLTLAEGVNDIELPDVMSSFEGSCGAPGPDVLFSFVAEVEGTYELDCKGLDDEILHPMQPGEVLYVIVDSHDSPGFASLTISQI